MGWTKIGNIKGAAGAETFATSAPGSPAFAALWNDTTGPYSPTTPATIYLAAVTTTPTRALAGTEPVGNSYGRLAVTQSGAWTTISTYHFHNANDLVWATASGAWGTITYIEAWDALTGGNRLWYAALSSPAAIDAAYKCLRILAGSLGLTMPERS